MASFKKKYFRTLFASTVCLTRLASAGVSRTRSVNILLRYEVVVSLYDEVEKFYDIIGICVIFLYGKAYKKINRIRNITLYLKYKDVGRN